MIRFLSITLALLLYSVARGGREYRNFDAVHEGLIVRVLMFVPLKICVKRYEWTCWLPNTGKVPRSVLALSGFAVLWELSRRKDDGNRIGGSAKQDCLFLLRKKRCMELYRSNNDAYEEDS